MTFVIGFLPGTEDTEKKILRETTTMQEPVLQRRQQTRQQGCPPWQFGDENVLVARMGSVADRAQTVQRGDAHGSREITV